ncbi:uncharacterized protein LOC118489219 [Helianthus annuus]|uniref:uncharacterized protein LOC118489219 n=1 Tax=Helianthus annuus TaxID=4232 RepID=UPI001652C34D|nr:uncharacterized protein LOC118489219 [Helianthus annuus]
MDFTWRLRPQGEYYDPEDIYGDEPRVFSVKINHGGEFTDYPGREYVNGKVSYIDWVEFDKFSVDVLREMLKDIGYSVDDVFNFFVKDPNVCLDFGLRHFTDDDELDYVYDQLRKGCKLVDLYVEIGESRIKDSTVMSLALLDNVGEDNVVEDESESSEAVSEGESESSDKENSDEEDPDYTFGQEPDNPVFDYEVDMSQFKACVDFDPDEVNETIRDARNENTEEELRLSGRAKCDILLNNICEVFNRQLIGARDKPVITCLEFIRVYMTKRIVNVKKVQAKSHGPLTPHAQEVFNNLNQGPGRGECSRISICITRCTK